MKSVHIGLGAAVLAALVGVLAGSDPSAEARAPRRDCFSASSVNGFRPVGREAVDVTVGASRHYRLDLLGYCPDVDWSQRIALRTRGGSSFICQGLDAELLVPGPTGVQRCPVSAVRRLTDEEYRASGRRR